ncbi:SDR family NAD(P)-dependent oxidoreductase [Psychrobium sp. nBUS_13]|uniref:SDR family NAD(P)-dependent oxidoreductase n=1 Tax=Psychrobium sp. nBUS_13 TaxID=3395319 RepID=UPI003EB8AB0D
MKKVAVVTGGSKGIGLAIVEKFIANDYQVYNLDLVASEIGIYKQCDMSDMAQVAHAISDIIEKTGQIDALICNAGIHYSANIEATSEQDFDKVFAVNVKGAYAAIQSSLSIMKSQQSGAIVIIASDQAMIGKTNSFAYNLSKHALASMAKTTALDYAKYNIRANALCPGTIETPLYHSAIDKYCAQSGSDKAIIHREEEALQPLGRLGQPEEVANYAYFLASEQASFITGSLQTIDGGYTAQ